MREVNKLVAAKRMPTCFICVWWDLQRGITCAAEAGRSRSPWGSRCWPCWVSVRGRYRERPAAPGQSFQEGRAVLEHVQKQRWYINESWSCSLININRRNLYVLSLCTFSFLRRVSAHSLSAVEAMSFDWTQMQHLGVLTDSIDLISDPVQGHDLALCDTERDRNTFN